MGFFKRFFGIEKMADEGGQIPASKKENDTKKTADKNDPAVTNKDGISEEIVAVITAAIADFENEAYVTKEFNLKPIDRRKGKLTPYGKERIYLNLR